MYISGLDLAISVRSLVGLVTIKKFVIVNF